MSVKLNMESVAGQMLGMTFGQTTGQPGGEDFEQLLWQMSTAKDELTAGSSQKPQGSQEAPKSQNGQRTETAQKPQQQTGQKADSTQSNQGAQSPAGQKQPGDAAEEPVLQELAAMFGQLQPINLNFAQEQAAGEVQAAGGVVVEAMTAGETVGGQSVAQQNMQQAAGELAAELNQSPQAEQEGALGQFAAAVAGSGEAQSGSRQPGSQILAEAGEVTGATAQEEPEAETLTAATDSQMFGELAAAPVKVAEIKQQTPVVQPETAEAAEQLAQHIQQALQAGETAVRINLSPANLGSLTVEIARLSDGTLSVILSAVTEKAANLLNKHSAGLQSLLMSNSQGQVRVEVENRPDAQPAQQFLNPEGESNAREQQQQQQERQRQEQQAPADFLQQLRLGLISLEQAV